MNKQNKIGKKCYIHKSCNIYGAQIGNNTKIGAFTEIQSGAIIGNNCKISSHSFICDGVIIEDNVFCGHGVMFTNDLLPRATNKDGTLKTGEDWTLTKTFIRKGASIGSNSTILCGIEIGENSLIGAGSVVTKNIPNNQIWLGNPAKFYKKL